MKDSSAYATQNERKMKMGKIEIKGKSIIFRRKDETTVIEPYGENCLRCRSTRNAQISQENWTLLPPVTEDSCVIEGDENRATITNGKISAVLEAGNWQRGQLPLYHYPPPNKRLSGWNRKFYG